MPMMLPVAEEALNEAEQTALSGLRDNYPPEEYFLQLTLRNNFVHATINMRPGAVAEHGLSEQPEAIVYHFDASGIAKLGEVA